MNYFAPGLRELARILNRLRRRAYLLWHHRKLGRLETRLGMLGWQQADYGDGMQHHVERLSDYERTQAELTNNSAALGLALQQAEECRRVERETYERQRAERQAARQPLVQPAEEAEKALADIQAKLANVEKQFGDLEREMVESEAKYRALLAKGDHNEQEASEVARLQNRVLSIPQEKVDWEKRHAGILRTLPRLETEAQERRGLVSVEDEALRSLEKSFTETDAALVAEIATKKREKQRIERQVNDVEKAKAKPYREIGKALADHQVEPVNQPEALSTVLAQREKIAAHEARIAASLEQSGQEKSDVVLGSWVLWFAILVFVFLGLWFAIHAR